MIIINSVVFWLIISLSINTYLMTMPMPVIRKKGFPATYMIQHENRIDFQKGTECAAFSTAYLLRHFGRDAEGETLYQHFPNKTRAGNVYPKGIRTVLRNYGFKTKYYKGNINTLKSEVSKGTPVIVFIKVKRDLKNLHFVPVVGYDKEYIYLSESLSHLVNDAGEQKTHNRKVPVEEFKKLWDVKRIHTLPYSNTYIAVEPE